MSRFLILLVVVFTFIKCQKATDFEQEEKYQFNVDITTEYNSEEIKKGDTIWFESKTNGMFVDIKSKEHIYFGEAIITVNLLIRSWNIQNQNNQYSKYKVLLRTPTRYITYTDKATMLGLFYYKDMGQYSMKFGVVFDTVGVYSIDADYLQFKNYHTNEIVKLGGEGIMKFNDLEDGYKEAYIYARMKKNNIDVYNSLTEDDKNTFNIIDDNNKLKYFFIKVVE